MLGVVQGGFGVPGYKGAESNRLFADWTRTDYSVHDIWSHDARVIGARAADLRRNDAVLTAMFNAMHAGVTGPRGMQWRSDYQIDDLPSESVDEGAVRSRIEARVHAGLGGTSIDAAGLLTLKSWMNANITSKGLYGDFFAQKLLLPRRPGRHSHATCWRVLHPMRCCNPDFAADTDRMHEGIELDDNGTPIAAHFLGQHPNTYRRSEKRWRWQRIPFYSPAGHRQLIWDAARIFPEQIRGLGWIGPLMGILKHLSKITEAHVVAKLMQASLGLIVEVTDPVKAARADRNGEVLTPNTKIVPGKTYYVRTGTRVTPLDFKYQGADYEAFTNQLLQALCAGFGSGVPYQYVLMQLTKSNMASSRAALMQAWRSFQAEQHDIEQNTLRWMVESLIAEDLAMGRLDLPTGDDLAAATSGHFIPPPRLVTDPAKEMNAAKTAHGERFASRKTVAQEFGGWDADDERRLIADELAADAAAGLPPIPQGGAPAAAAPDPMDEAPTETELDPVDEDADTTEQERAA